MIEPNKTSRNADPAATPVLGYATPGETPPRNSPGKVVAGGVLVVIGLFFIAGMLIPSTGRPREGANRIKCASNLKEIGYCLQMYSDAHGKRYPPTLDELLVECDITSIVFCCPSSDDERAQGPTTQAVVQELHKPGHNSYVYVAGNQPDQNLSDKYVLAYEPPGNHANDGMNVLYSDGHVDWVAKTEAPRVIAELQAGFNPPRPPASQPTGR